MLGHLPGADKTGQDLYLQPKFWIQLHLYSVQQGEVLLSRKDKKKLSPSVIRRNSRRKVEYLKKKSDVPNESDNYLEVKTPSQDVIAFCVTNVTTQPAEK